MNFCSYDVDMNNMNSENKVKERVDFIINARLRQTEIAKEVGVCRSYVSQIVLGRYPFRGPRSDRVRQAIARRLGKTFEEVWGN